MEMRKYIEMGEKKAGKQIELARILNVRDSTLRLAKLGNNGLPDAICIKLADYIEVDRLEVIAASNLVTEKDEERRRIFESCFKKTSNAAASIATVILLTTVLTLSPIKSVQAASLGDTKLSAMYIMLKRIIVEEIPKKHRIDF
ncbi:hypothetical protein [Nitrosomonas communis]|uniref:Uncharacterized protein n=1 Tax=Nitrosomonas communis TaxID=44574 RepID=A0A1I4PSD4_9PROT|nr:hypothetical protein [Nitrosomonas communis]SFM30634.1 hypothetical protein SAMN05421863_102253 [Nitrosomonas communis]